MLHDIPPIAPGDTILITDKNIIVASKDGKTYYDINKFKIPKNVYGEKSVNLETAIYNLTSNILEYCQLNHIGIGEFEKSVDVSYGYFSRIRKTMNPTLEIIVKVANKLDYSIAELFSAKWNEIKENVNG